MKLGLYSGGDSELNARMDQEVLGLVAKKSDIKVAFIPACSYNSEAEYFYFINQYEKFNISRFIHFPVDIPFDDVLLNEVMNCDLIHLGGGNTFYFLSHLRQSGVLSLLSQFSKKGGVLTGESAGAIILTPKIDTASFPAFDCDDNDEGVKNWKALGLVNFYFFPHYKKSKRYDTELIAYSKKVNQPILSCRDGQGVVVDGLKVSLIGKVHCFYQGKKVSFYNAKA